MASTTKSGAKTIPTKKANTITFTSSGQPSLRKEDYPLLERLLSKPQENTLSTQTRVSSGAQGAGAVASTSHAPYAVSGTSSSGFKVQSTLKTQKGTFKGKSINTLSGISTTKERAAAAIQRARPARNDELWFGDNNEGKRGQKVTVDTLADYLFEVKIFDAEEFQDHATQYGYNEGTRIYRALASKDWDKKIGQAIDIARSFTPNTSFRARVENYKKPDDLDLWKATCTYNEYLELFQHHGIGDDKLRRWFKTLFGDNGKRNTIYMWGRADAGKTTIIKMFDAFYEKWEIGRCAAQSINSNFWLQDLYQKRLFHADEIIATQVNIDTLKLLLEGSDDLTTDIKYAKKVSIRGKPVLMATNEPIWIHMSTAIDPIKKRCEYIKLTRAWDKPVKFMSTRDKNILQYVQNRLFRELFPNGYDEWLMTEQFTSHIDEFTDEELANLPPINIDNFVSEMN